jgi:Ca-activated chloride channel family protein
MSRLLSLAIAVVVVTALAAQQTTFRSGARTVAVYATVIDSSGRLVVDLSRLDFQIRDNGRPVEITLFSNELQPITVALMLDMSSSMEPRYMRVRESTMSLAQTLMPWDRMTIGTFGQEVAVSPLLTGDKAELTRVISEELWPGGGTPLWQAIDTGMTALTGESGRRVVLVLTDGEDTGGLPNWNGNRESVERRAQDSEFMIYAIGMEGTGLKGGIDDLADETGGGHFELKRDADLPSTFARVSDELRHQYVLGFTPASLDGKKHSLDVRVTRRDLNVRARKSYQAHP